MYLDENSADISIFVHRSSGADVLRRAADIELAWTDNDVAYSTARDLRFHSFERIEVRMHESAIEDFRNSSKMAA